MGCLATNSDRSSPHAAEQRQIVDPVGPGDHACDQVGDFLFRVRAKVSGEEKVLVREDPEVDFHRQAPRGGEAGGRHEICVVEPC